MMDTYGYVSNLCRDWVIPAAAARVRQSPREASMMGDPAW